ncbi:hypothetical protein BDK51DRAFT_48122 [Blyttiomyces helicus]|uniref:Uncharacterized protein n=1 Tax=Blyttiomyces helicus TaxID=388810 RepID=A0A4P9W5E1_9FUNG|nr:hypothetical protein BDK51DRAFT_48122 [Blyttiomyces helicus]|eukprot:RKO85316.1 hypothetical protein BDK51DRAFT_48122 [Blyttiomyces helicus]
MFAPQYSSFDSFSPVSGYAFGNASTFEASPFGLMSGVRSSPLGFGARTSGIYGQSPARNVYGIGSNVGLGRTAGIYDQRTALGYPGRSVYGGLGATGLSCQQPALGIFGRNVYGRRGFPGAHGMQAVGVSDLGVGGDAFTFNRNEIVQDLLDDRRRDFKHDAIVEDLIRQRRFNSLTDDLIEDLVAGQPVDTAELVEILARDRAAEQLVHLWVQRTNAERKNNRKTDDVIANLVQKGIYRTIPHPVTDVLDGLNENIDATWEAQADRFIAHLQNQAKAFSSRREYAGPQFGGQRWAC